MNNFLFRDKNFFYKLFYIVESITMWLIGVPLAFIGAFVFKLEVQWAVLPVMAEEIAKVTCSAEAKNFKMDKKCGGRSIINSAETKLI